MIKRMTVLSLLAILCAIVSANALAARGNDDERIRLRTRLFHTDAQPLASGKAKYEMRISDGEIERMRFSVEAEDTNGVDEIEVVVGGMSWFVLFDPVFQEFDLNLDSRDGDFVPELIDGDPIDVYDTATGELILTGNLSGPH